ncbi:MAG: hypothetical protein RLZZ323_720, partial [Bacteroidota bacterium]
MYDEIIHTYKLYTIFKTNLLLKTNLKLFSILILAFISCKKETEKTIVENFCSDQLEIILDNDRIVIDKESGKGVLEIIESPTKKQTKTFILNKTEIEKLFNNGFGLIKLTNYNFYTKTCYAGQNFTLRLNCPNKSLEWHNSSVANWSKISNETN